ncbi:type 1 fimbria pilin [Luteibacter sp. Sphag1AF]|uniref:fimbrial protein n=1 Tax=Luteibacter sp. Sphag1AF TaxID=2587031 RepID=UPI00161B0CE3|nr:type 1 fimbrial protein [Luteibacter sp. Sphag1AF]MBB3227642.1 type 1 fimbria pilin [Luteibacter sp. Sphag1AF]
MRVHERLRRWVPLYVALAGFALCTIRASTIGPELRFVVSGTLAGSCGFATDDITFDLKDVYASAFEKPGATHGHAESAIRSTGCFGVSRVKMIFSGDQVAGYPELFGVSPGGAKGIAVRLDTLDGRPVIPGREVHWAPQPQGGGYGFVASYVRTGDMKAGAAHARIVVDITYD